MSEVNWFKNKFLIYYYRCIVKCFISSLYKMATLNVHFVIKNWLKLKVFKNPFAIIQI